MSYDPLVTSPLEYRPLKLETILLILSGLLGIVEEECLSN